MANILPTDRVVCEQVLRGNMKDVIESVQFPGFAPIQVHGRERFAETDVEDEALSTFPDPVKPKVVRTGVVQILRPTVEEDEYVNDGVTKLTLTYPIVFDLEVVDYWPPDGIRPFTNSHDLATAYYLRVAEAFKFNRTFGYDNCVHNYLQLISAVTVTDEETLGRVHSDDWQLQVIVTSMTG